MNNASSQAILDLPENVLLFDRIDTTPKDPEWIFDGLWQARTFALFTGDGGLGKSHFTFQVAVAIASGTEILGTPIRCPKPKEFVYITQEDEADFVTAEMLDQCPELKHQPEVTQRIRIISTAIQGKTMLIREPTTQQYLEQHIPQDGIFALDAFSTFIKGNEIDNTEMQQEMAAIRKLAKARKASPFLIHHRPKPNSLGQQSTFRGAVSIQQPVRFHIMLERQSKGTKLSFEKVSRGLPPEPIMLSFDEDRRIFLPIEEDRYVKVFGPEETLTTTEVINRLGLNTDDDNDRKRVLNGLAYRSRGHGAIKKVTPGKNRQDATWKINGHN